MEGGGLSQLRDSQFSTYGPPEGLSNEVVLTVTETRDSLMWIGTEAGLNRLYDGEIRTYTEKDGLSSNWIYALLEDHDEDLWVGTYGGGLNRMENGSFTSYTEEDGLPSNNVYSLEQTRDGAIWAGTERGLTRLHNGNIQNYGQEEGLTHNLITALHQDADGQLWIGTYGGGLSQYDDGTFENYGKEEGLTSRTILALQEDSSGSLWIGTAGGGLCRRNAPGFRCYTSADGLFSDDILQVLVDNRGYLWLGSLQGFNRIHRDSLLSYDGRDTTLLTGRSFDTSDGLRSAEANGGTQPAAWKASNGHLWFSTMKGVAVVNPLRTPVNTTSPLVKIERFVIDGKTATTDRSTVPPDNRMIEIVYTGLSFVAPNKVTFQYKLEGLQETWQDVDTRRRAYFSSLPPGDYESKVRAINADGVISENAAAASFYVQPYLYETSWFYLLVAIALIGGAGAAYRLRVRHLRTRQQELSRRVEEKTAELQERETELKALNKDLEKEVQRKVDIILDERRRYEQQLIEAKKEAEESARLKTNILNNMSHEIRTPLTSILGFADMLAENARPDQEELLEYVRQSGERLLETLDSVLDLAKVRSGNMELKVEPMDLVEETRQIIQVHQPKAEKKNIDLRFQPPEEHLQVQLECSCVHRIVDNLVENAVKFTEEGYVCVSITAKDRQVQLIVEDTGIGISESFMPELFQEFKQESSGNARSHRGTGLGLALTRNLVEIMNGSIDVESEQGKGTRFIVTLPRNLERELSDAAGEGRMTVPKKTSV